MELINFKSDFTDDIHQPSVKLKPRGRQVSLKEVFSLNWMMQSGGLALRHSIQSTGWCVLLLLVRDPRLFFVKNGRQQRERVSIAGK